MSPRWHSLGAFVASLCGHVFASPQERADVVFRPAPDSWSGSISGQARTMVESYHNLDFGLGEIRNDTWTHQRLQALFAAKKGNWLQLSTELTWGRMWGKKGDLAPPDQDQVDLLQFFAKVRLSQNPSDEIFLQLGRQDLYYGSGRLFASREGANQRLSHEAIRISWKHGNRNQLDAFVGTPVSTRPGAFDNQSEPTSIRFWSIYDTFTIGERQSLDFYYIGLRDEDSIYNRDGGHETRHTVGLRYATLEGPWICNSELIYQFGKAGEYKLSAGAASLGIGWQFSEIIGNPSFILRGDIISGGGGTGTDHTFNPLFQANNYFNEGGFITPSNLYNVNPVVVLEPREDLIINLGINFQWRFDAADAVYGTPLHPIAGQAPDGETYLGTAYNASIEWSPGPHTTVFFGYTHHDAGPSLTSVGGGDVDYLQFSLRRTF